MANVAQTADSQLIERRSPWGDLLRKEDWWAIWIGLSLIQNSLHQSLQKLCEIII